MATVKTAVSLDRALFEATEALARRMKTSRSHVVALALDEFLRGQRNLDLLAGINAALEGAGDAEDGVALDGMRRLQRGLVEGRW